MIAKIPNVRVVCGNKKCRESSEDPSLEINFFTREIVYVCPDCGDQSTISLRVEAQPFPKSRRLQ